MNKQQKKKTKAASKGLAAAYITYESSQSKVGRVESGTDIVEAEVLGNTNYFATGYAINPGLDSRFPALSQEAKRFDCYEFIELSFRFVGTTVISTTVGQIGLAFDPNPHSQAPTTQAKFSAYECHVASSVYRPDGITLNVPRRMLAGRRYVRYGIEGNSLFQFDPGMLVIMVRDEVNADPIGYVEARYKIRFSDYHLEPTTSPISSRVLQLYKAATQNYVTTVQADWTFDAVSTNIGGMEYVIPSDGTVNLGRGVYHITVVLFVSDSANEAMGVNAQLHVDGVAEMIVTQLYSTTGTLVYGTFNIDTIVSLADASAITVPVTLSGAAGALTLAGGSTYSRLIVVAL
jgi:hypothetical protein